MSISIIAGRAKGRRLESPKGRWIRPTSGRIKEALFDILGDRIPGATILDLFAGTGSLGLEALSRGAREAVFVDASLPCVSMIQRNIEVCGFTGEAEVLHKEVDRAVTSLHNGMRYFDTIFLDPPYEQGLAKHTLACWAQRDVLSEHGCLVAEHSVRERLEFEYGYMKRSAQRRYGDTVVSFFVKESDERE